MSSKTVADIIVMVREDLGNPDPVIELTDNTITRYVTDAIATFNSLVGKMNVRVLSSTQNVQSYNLNTIFSADIIDVKKIIADPIITDKIVGATSELVSPGVISFDATQVSQVASAEDIDKIYNKPTLMIIPAPDIADKKYVLITQESYTLADIPEEYLSIVLKYLNAICENVVTRARLRLATPMRQGDFIMGYGKKEELLTKDAEKLEAKFRADCAELALARMVG